MIKFILIFLLALGSAADGAQAPERSTRPWWKCCGKERVVPGGALEDVFEPDHREVRTPKTRSAGASRVHVAPLVVGETPGTLGVQASSASVMLSPVAVVIPEVLPDSEPYICLPKYDPAFDLGYPSELGAVDADIPGYEAQVECLNRRAAIRRAAALDLTVVTTSRGNERVIDLILADPGSLQSVPALLDYPMSDPRRDVAFEIMRRYRAGIDEGYRVCWTPLQIALHSSTASKKFLQELCYEVARQEILRDNGRPCNAVFLEAFEGVLESVFPMRIQDVLKPIMEKARIVAHGHLRLMDWLSPQPVRVARTLTRAETTMDE